MSEKYQAEFPNTHYLANLSSLNLTNNDIQLGRLPTLGEILSNKTKAPLNLFNFYLYLKNVENSADYLDFWFDLVNHLNLCKHYLKGLRESVARQSAGFVSPSRSRQPSRHGSQLGLNNPFNGSPHVEDAEFFSNRDSKHKSLSLSMLLDLIIKDHILEDDDSHRLLAFLRGDIHLDTVDPKLKLLIENYDADDTIAQPAPILDRSALGASDYRKTSNSKLMEDYPDLHYRRESQALTPSFVEKLLRDSKASSILITRATLRESSQNLLLKYFVEDSEKWLNISPRLQQQVAYAIQTEGRDDPDVFNYVKRDIFTRLENVHLPNFLNFLAIKNVTRTTTTRVIVGFFFVMISFWIAYSLIFLDESKRYRAVIVVPFFAGFYSLISAVYMIDPFLAVCRRSEGFAEDVRFIRVEDNFVYSLLMKRSAWVLFLVILLTAIFTVILCVVPGKRL